MPYLPPLFIDINVSPVTKVATVTQTANALSLGSPQQRRSGVQRCFDHPVSKQLLSQSTVYRSPSCTSCRPRAIDRS